MLLINKNLGLLAIVILIFIFTGMNIYIGKAIKINSLSEIPLHQGTLFKVNGIITGVDLDTRSITFKDDSLASFTVNGELTDDQLLDNLDSDFKIRVEVTFSRSGDDYTLNRIRKIPGVIYIDKQTGITINKTKN